MSGKHRPALANYPWKGLGDDRARQRVVAVLRELRKMFAILGGIGVVSRIVIEIPPEVFDRYISDKDHQVILEGMKIRRGYDK